MVLHRSGCWVILSMGLLAVEAMALELNGKQEECTTAIVAGEVSRSGRPILWKNRDSSVRDNALVRLQGPRFAYLALINIGDTSQVWAGLNEAGFAVMNAEALDLEGDSLDAEGYFMAEALGTCATVQDFEELLRTTNGSKRGTKSNFGTIDAQGGVAYFEAGNRTYARYDARAEGGWLVRTNFAQTGDGSGGGVFRFVRARELLRRLQDEGAISPLSFLRILARDLVPPSRWLPDFPSGRWIPTSSSINRYRTVACVVIEGSRAGEDPRSSVMWVILGEPLFGVAVPLWVSAGEVPEPLRGPSKSELNARIQALEDKAYPVPGRPDLLDSRWLEDPETQAWLLRVEEFERRWFERADSLREAIASGRMAAETLQKLQSEAAEEARQLFP